MTFLRAESAKLIELSKLLEEQKRCGNRLYDPEMVELYLALQKRLNKRAEDSTLDIDAFFLDVPV